MIYVNVILSVKPEFGADVEEIKGLLSRQGELSRQEPGCQRFEVYHSQSDRNVFLLCEHWESQQTLDEHRQAAAYTEIYKPRILPRVNRVPHVADLVQ